MKHPPFDPKEHVLTLGDISRLFKALRKQLLFIGCFFGLLGASFQLFRSPQYLIQATFKEGIEKGDDGGLKDLLGGFGLNAKQPEVVFLMQSHQVLRPLIERFGLQLQVPLDGFLTKLCQNCTHQWKAEQGIPLPEIDRFSFQNVHSDLEEKTFYALRFTQPNSFELLNAEQTCLAQGKIGQLVETKELSFICQKTPSKLEMHKLYPLQLTPWTEVLSGLKKALKISNHKANKSIYDLSLEFSDRQKGTALLNELMEEYQRYLKTEHDQIAKEQIAYLEAKQNQIYDKMGFVFDEHAAYLKEALQSRGFIGLKESMESFVNTHEEIQEKISAIDMELEQLEGLQTVASCLGDSPFAKTLLETAQQIQQLEQQRDTLELALQDKSSPHHREALFRELSSVRAEKMEVQQLSTEIATNSSFKLPTFLAWSQNFPIERNEFANYLSHHLHLLTLKEKILQERWVHPIQESTQFEGIDLANAQLLHVQYTQKLDQVEAEACHLEKLKQQIEQQEAELASLGSTLEDPFSKQLIQQASQIAHLLKDEKHRTEKEVERWTRELAFQKKLLCQHIEQLKNLKNLNASLLKEKMTDLQRASLSCVHQQLSLAQERTIQLVEQRKKTLKEEKQLFVQKMEDIRSMAADLPERWKQEHWLELKTEMGTKIIRVLTELVESKTIGRHLHHVESKPLDRAIPPRLAQKPQFLAMGFGLAFGSTFVFFVISLLWNLVKNFPVSADRLQALCYPFSGILQKENRETLRRLALFVEQAPSSKVVGLIGGEGPNYTTDFVHNLSLSGHSILLIDCDFNAPTQNSTPPGLLQWFEKKLSEIPIQKGPFFHSISSGGYSLLGVELIRSKQFEEWLQQIKLHYDFIFLWQKSSLQKVEAISLLSLVDKAIVTVSNEPTELLTPFIQWAYHEENCRLTFVTSG